MSISQANLSALVTVEDFYAKLLSNSYNTKELQRDIKINPSDILKNIEFTQNAYYHLSESQYSIWPKIYSINLNSHDKQIITLEFRHNPNLDNLKRLMHLYSAKYTIKLHKVNDPSTAIESTTVKIDHNGIYVLAHLINIYYSMAKEAGVLIWEALRYVVQDAMDKGLGDSDSEWKMDTYYKIKLWAASVDDRDDSRCVAINEKLHFPHLDRSHDAKTQYNLLDDTQKEKFIEAILSQLVKVTAAELVRYVSSTASQTIVQSAFDSVEKCDSYLIENMPEMVEDIKKIQNATEAALVKKFEPGFWEEVFSKGDKVSKHIKYASTATGSTLSLLDKAKELTKISKDLPLIKHIFTAIDLIKIASFMFYETQEAYFSSSKEENLEIDLTELSYKFVCMNMICNKDSLTKLSENSIDKLIEFYSNFMYAAIKGHKYEDNFSVSDYLLKQISNTTYVEELGLTSYLSTTLEQKDGNILSMADLVTSYDHGACYNTLANYLSGNTSSSVTPEILMLNV